MKQTFILAALIIGILSACNQLSNKSEPAKDSTTQTFNLDTTKLKSGEVYYQCEMDPEILSDRPGICPKCEMQLTERRKQ